MMPLPLLNLHKKIIWLTFSLTRRPSHGMPTVMISVQTFALPGSIAEAVPRTPGLMNQVLCCNKSAHTHTQRLGMAKNREAISLSVSDVMRQWQNAKSQR